MNIAGHNIGTHLNQIREETGHLMDDLDRAIRNQHRMRAEKEALSTRVARQKDEIKDLHQEFDKLKADNEDVHRRYAEEKKKWEEREKSYVEELNRQTEQIEEFLTREQKLMTEIAQARKDAYAQPIPIQTKQLGEMAWAEGVIANLRREVANYLNHARADRAKIKHLEMVNDIGQKTVDSLLNILLRTSEILSTLKDRGPTLIDQEMAKQIGPNGPGYRRVYKEVIDKITCGELK